MARTWLAAAGALLAACLDEATSLTVADLNARIELPPGWQVVVLAAPWRAGLASPATVRARTDAGQPADNPRWQDVLVGVELGRTIESVADAACRGERREQRLPGARRVIRCDGQRATEGDVQMLLPTREAFVALPAGVLHLSLEGRGGAVRATAPALLDTILERLRVGDGPPAPSVPPRG